MSVLATTRRAAFRAPRLSRTAVVNAPAHQYVSKREAIVHHAAGTTDLWRKISFYIGIPAIIVTSAWVWKVEAEHHEHEEHLKAEHGGRLPEPPANEYLNVRHKPFPWGSNSLFFNPAVNKDMSKVDE